MSYDNHDRCRRCGADDNGHTTAECDRNLAERAKAQRARDTRISSPAEVLAEHDAKVAAQRANIGPEVDHLVAIIVSRLRATPGTVVGEDAPRAVAEAASERFRGAGWSVETSPSGRDNGASLRLYVGAPKHTHGASR